MIQRSFRYYYLRVTRQRGTPENVAFGMAIGVFFGLLLPAGQIIAALLAATVLKANRVTAFLGTWVSNPATFMLIIPFYLTFGQTLTGIRLRDHVKSKPTLVATQQVTGELPLPIVLDDNTREEEKPTGFAAVIAFCERVVDFVKYNGAPATIRLLAVWLSAAVPCSIVGFLVSYQTTRILVEGFRRKQMARRSRKRAIREQRAAEEEALRGVHSGLDEN